MVPVESIKLREASSFREETKNGPPEDMMYSPSSTFSAGQSNDTRRLRFEISRLSKAGSASEVRQNLRRVLEAMECADITARLAMRNALDRAVPDMHTKNYNNGRRGINTEKKNGWTRENRAFFVSMIITFYKGDCLSLLPREVVCGSIFAFFPPKQLAHLASVSRGFKQLADSDASWQATYDRAFGNSKAGVTYDYGASLKESYHQRIRDPSTGDRVEVAWQGRFRLEGLEVYRGLAWWAAEVAEKRPNDIASNEEDMIPPEQFPPQHIDNQVVPHEQNHEVDLNNNQQQQNNHQPTTNPINELPPATTESSAQQQDNTSKRYRVHYLNWDSRWDEWVSREQLRWPVQEGKNCTIEIGDDVEVWCSGNTVPGAWLRAVVDAVDDDLFCVGNVASSGHLWVSRDRVRLVRRKADRVLETTQDYDTAVHRRGRRLPSCLIAPLHRLRDLWTRSPSVPSLSCAFAPFHHRRSSSSTASQQQRGARRNTTRAPPRTSHQAATEDGAATL